MSCGGARLRQTLSVTKLDETPVLEHDQISGEVHAYAAWITPNVLDDRDKLTLAEAQRPKVGPKLSHEWQLWLEAI